MRKIRLICNQQIGDCLRTTTVAKLIKDQYPGIVIRPVMSHPCVYENNPNVEIGLTPGVKNTKGGSEVCLNIVCNQDDENGSVDNEYSIHRLHSHDGSMLHGMIGYINAKYGFDIEITEIEPDIYLSEDEKKKTPISSPYWLVNCGGAINNTKKQWPGKYWRELFNSLPDINFVQTGLSKDNYDYSNEFENVWSSLGCSIRDSFGYAYNALGVITGYSYILHAAAAFHKPVITIGGGTEHPQWETYDYEGFNLLHTIGSFECCRDGGCWRPKCDNKTEDGTQKCMELITPNFIKEIIETETLNG